MSLKYSATTKVPASFQCPAQRFATYKVLRRHVHIASAGTRCRRLSSAPPPPADILVPCGRKRQEAVLELRSTRPKGTRRVRARERKRKGPNGSDTDGASSPE